MSNDKKFPEFILQVGPKCFVKENTLFQLVLSNTRFEAYRSARQNDLCRMSKLIYKSYGIKCVVVSFKDLKGKG